MNFGFNTKSALNQAKRVFQCLRAINHTKTYDNVVILAPFIRKQRLFQNQDVTFVQAFVLIKFFALKSSRLLKIVLSTVI